jgi:hypothetical protein
MGFVNIMMQKYLHLLSRAHISAVKNNISYMLIELSPDGSLLRG